MHVASLELSKELYDEEWRKIDGVNYEVSNLGRVRHISRGTIRKLYYNKDGYASFSYNTGTAMRNLMVHVAVAKAFIPMVSGKYQVNHKDSNPAHNCANNLEWCTPKENIEHALTHGRADRYQNRGDKHGMSKLTNTQAINIKHCRGAISGIKLAALYAVDSQTIYDIWSGKRWQHVS